MTRRRRSGDQVRSLVLVAARELFATHGFQRTSTREIAARAGVSERLIYFHFTSKTGLFERAVSEPFTAFMEQFIADWRGYADSPHDFEDLARRWIGGMYDLFRTNRQLVLALLTASAYEDGVEDTLSGKDSPLASIHRLTEEILAAEAEKRGYDGLDLGLTVRIPFATVLATALFEDPVLAGIGRRPSRATVVEEMAALTLYGATGRARMKAADHPPADSAPAGPDPASRPSG